MWEIMCSYNKYGFMIHLLRAGKGPSTRGQSYQPTRRLVTPTWLMGRWIQLQEHRLWMTMRSYWSDWYVKVQSALKFFHTRRNLEKGALPCSTGAGVLIAWSQVAESHLVKAIFVSVEQGLLDFTWISHVFAFDTFGTPAKARQRKRSISATPCWPATQWE